VCQGTRRALGTSLSFLTGHANWLAAARQPAKAFATECLEEDMSATKRWVLAAALLLSPGLALADTVPLEVTLAPQPPDLNDLDHYKVYFWGFDLAVDPALVLTQATLTFDNIRNWDHNDNVLYIHALDTASLGVHTVTDNQGGGDYFVTQYAGVHQHLVTYCDLPDKAQDLVYTFPDDELAALSSYLADGRAAVGLDPDCRFYNDGVALKLAFVPEPPSLGLLVLGSLGLIWRRRRVA
jgi:hypothetical protein